MKVQTFKRSLASILAFWSEGDYDTALHEVEVLLKAWPGNARLHLMRAGLIQLQDDPKEVAAANGGKAASCR